MSASRLFVFAVAAVLADLRLAASLCAPPAMFVVLPSLVLGAAHYLGFDGDDLKFVTRASAISYLLTFVALAPTATGWHRRLIDGAADRGDGSIYGWDGREWRYLFYWVLIMMIFIVLAMLSSCSLGALALSAPSINLGKSEFVLANIILSLAVWTLFALITARFGMTLPAAAVGERMHLAQASVMVEGMTWKIAGALLLAGLASTLFGMALEVASGAIGYVPVLNLLLWGLSMCAHFATILVSVGILSRAYGLLSQGSGTAPRTV